MDYLFHFDPLNFFRSFLLISPVMISSLLKAVYSFLFSRTVQVVPSKVNLGVYKHGEAERVVEMGNSRLTNIKTVSASNLCGLFVNTE